MNRPADSRSFSSFTSALVSFDLLPEMSALGRFQSVYTMSLTGQERT
jgi:hypothetical protein